jgi:hypothetical protein
MPTKRNLWPYGLITAFVLFFCGMATVITIAVTHQESLVSSNYYEQEIVYQRQLDALGRAQQAGAKLQYDATAGQLLVVLPEAQLTATQNGTVVFYRPSAPALDTTGHFGAGPERVHKVDATKLVAGPWTAKVSWEVAGQTYYLEQKFVVPPAKS